jgi:hypothetical protein
VPKGLTLADLDDIDKAVEAQRRGGRLSSEDVMLRDLAAHHAPAMSAAIRAMRKVARAALPFEEFLKAGASAGGKHATLLDALREFQAGPFAGLLETVSGEGGEDAKT